MGAPAGFAALPARAKAFKAQSRALVSNHLLFNLCGTSRSSAAALVALTTLKQRALSGPSPLLEALDDGGCLKEHHAECELRHHRQGVEVRGEKSFLAPIPFVRDMRKSHAPGGSQVQVEQRQRQHVSVQPSDGPAGDPGPIIVTESAQHEHARMRAWPRRAN